MCGKDQYRKRFRYLATLGALSPCIIHLVPTSFLLCKGWQNLACSQVVCGVPTLYSCINHWPP